VVGVKIIVTIVTTDTGSGEKVNGAYLRVEPVNKKSSPFLKKEEEISENKKTHDKKAATNGVFRASR